MVLLFESEDVIRGEVEHSVFAGSTNEGLARGLASFKKQDVPAIMFFCDCWCKNAIVLLGGMWTLCKGCDFYVIM